MACFCSSQAPPDANRVEDKWCDKPCAGYPFEMCGSALVAGDVNLAGAGVEVGGGAYANVILVGNSLAPGSATPSPSPSAAEAVVTPVSGESPEKNGSPPATTATAAAVADKGSLHPEVRNDSKSVEETNNSLGDDQDSMDEGGDDDEDINDGKLRRQYVFLSIAFSFRGKNDCLKLSSLEIYDTEILLFILFVF